VKLNFDRDPDFAKATNGKFSGQKIPFDVPVIERKNGKVLRLRLGNALVSRGTDWLAFAQDDGLLIPSNF